MAVKGGREGSQRRVDQRDSGTDRREKGELTSSSLEVVDFCERAGIVGDLLIVGSESVSWRRKRGEERRRRSSTRNGNQGRGLETDER